MTADGERAAKPARGKFIVFEGPDGVGKTTQIKLLHDWLVERHGEERFVRTFQPSQGPMGQLLRGILRGEYELSGSANDWRTMALLFVADRNDHLDRVIRPALEAGKTVLCDRYDLSTRACQAACMPDWPGVGGELAKDNGRRWLQQLHEGTNEPDLVVLFDAPDEVLLKRLGARPGRDTLESEALLPKIAAEYRRPLFARTYYSIDGQLPVQEIFDRLRRDVGSWLANALESSG